MKKSLVIIGFLFSFMPLSGAFAAMHSPIALEHVKIDRDDAAAQLRGARFFAKNCMTCHSMKYLQHDALAQAAGITLDKMPLKNQTWWLGVVPPDLSLIARQYSPNWLYTYLHAFYKDPARPTGYNNLLKKDVNMLNVLAAYQGEQVLLSEADRPTEKHLALSEPHYYSRLKLVRPGSMSQEAFDATMTDSVNFLVYAGDPAYTRHRALGYWVIGFLLMLLVLAVLLKKEYWKGVPRKGSLSKK